jgi:hypothetical protein
MAVERVSASSSLIDVLDRILDKGIVLDAWVRISLMGINLMTIEDRIVVTSIDTCLQYAAAPGLGGLTAKPAQSERAPLPDISSIAPRTARRRR